MQLPGEEDAGLLAEADLWLAYLWQRAAAAAGLELRAVKQLVEGHDVLVSKATAVAASMRPVRPKVLTSMLIDGGLSGGRVGYYVI